MTREFKWINDYTRKFLSQGEGYLIGGQTAEERLKVIADTAENILGIEGFSDKFLDYVSNGWYSLSTPIWCNFGLERGSPISCFGSQIDDSVMSILDTLSEVGMMTKIGGGTSAYFGRLRGRGAEITDNGVSSGSVHFMQLFQTMIGIIGQGKSRRGNFAAYLDIDHPDIMEFLNIRYEGSPLQHISSGVCVTDEFMKEAANGNYDKQVVWAKVLEARQKTGHPYIFFTDNINNNTVDVYKDKGLKITHSNLCSEILLHDNDEESFVCNLASMNILHYDEWKDTDAVETLTFFLDAVMTEFINKNKGVQYMEKAVRFAERQRALGIGWLGWHSYLQEKMIPFESMSAHLINIQVAKTIQTKAWNASKELAKLYGEPELLKGYGRRNVTLTAIAPTKSTSFIHGQVSEGIEPIKANAYIKDLQKGRFSIRNTKLVEVLERYGKNTEEVWEDITNNWGSVQHLDFLTDNEREVFKTFEEISPKAIITQAAGRQKYVDQGQSTNIMIHPEVHPSEINELMYFAWENGIKTLYYNYSISAARMLSQKINHCVACE